MKKSKLLFVVLLSTMILCFTGCGNNQSSIKTEIRILRMDRKTTQMKHNLTIMTMLQMTQTMA